MVLLGYRHTIILHNKKAGIMLLPWYVVVRALRGECCRAQIIVPGVERSASPLALIERASSHSRRQVGWFIAHLVSV
jgi:hypothetical protein